MIEEGPRDSIKMGNDVHNFLFIYFFLKYYQIFCLGFQFSLMECHTGNIHHIHHVLYLSPSSDPIVYPACESNKPCNSGKWSLFFFYPFSLLQDDYVEALGRLHLTVSRAYRVNPEINFEVFIHKVDGLSDDHKIETQRDIHQRANDDLADASLEKLHLR